MGTFVIHREVKPTKKARILPIEGEDVRSNRFAIEGIDGFVPKKNQVFNSSIGLIKFSYFYGGVVKVESIELTEQNRPKPVFQDTFSSTIIELVE